MVEQATESLLTALAEVFGQRDVWPTAEADPDAHHQMLALLNGFIELTSAGYALTDLGRAELDAFEARTR